MDERTLTAEERASIFEALSAHNVAPSEICRESVDQCRLVRRIPAVREIRGPRTAVAHIALRARARGVTLGDRIYLRSDCLDSKFTAPLELLTHEVVHVAQYRRDGTARFLSNYLWEYALGLARGLDDRDAYLAISYEREARRVAESIAS